MKPRRIVLIVSVSVLFVLAIGYCGYRALSAPLKTDLIALQTLDGELLDTRELFSGKYTILNFWATWCGPCIKEMPVLDSLYRKLDHQTWQIFLVSDEPLEKVIAFRDARSFSIPFISHTSSLGTIGVSALPRTVVLNASGEVVFDKLGEIKSSTDNFYAKLQKAVAQH